MGFKSKSRSSISQAALTRRCASRMTGGPPILKHRGRQKAPAEERSETAGGGRRAEMKEQRSALSEDVRVVQQAAEHLPGRLEVEARVHHHRTRHSLLQGSQGQGRRSSDWRSDTSWAGASAMPRCEVARAPNKNAQRDLRGPLADPPRGRGAPAPRNIPFVVRYACIRTGAAH